jgi:hypothetical protein
MRIEDSRIQINGQWHQIIQNDRIAETLQEFCRVIPFFNNFFTEEIPSYLDIHKINWVINASLNPLGEAIPDTENLPPRFYCIVLRRFPEVPKDAFLLAHEIEHCVFNELNFPIVDSDLHLTYDMRSYAKPIFNAFNSMIYDKMVNAKLKNYHFDLTECIETNWQPVQVKNNYELIFRTFRYVIKRRSARLLSDINPEYEADLLSWYSENLPRVKQIGDEVFEIIEGSPSDSPEEIISIIHQIALLFNWKLDPMKNSIKIWIRRSA